MAIGIALLTAADRVGVSQGTFNQSLQAFGKRLGELKTRGSGALATQLKALNPALYETLEATESTQEAFEIYIQAMRESGDASERNAMASAAFSRAGLKMGLIAQSSSEEINRLRERAQELGYVLSDEDLAAAEKFTDEMTNMKATLGGVSNLVGAQLMPVLGKFFNRFTGFIVENRANIAGWAETIATKTEEALPTIISTAKGIGEMMMTVGRLTGKLANLVGGFDNLAMIMVGLKFVPLTLSVVSLGKEFGLLAAKYLPAVVTGIKAVGAAMLTNPVGLILTGIAAAALAVYTYWEPISGFFSNLWEGITSKAGEAFDWIGKKLAWVGSAAREVGNFFGFGDDDETGSSPDTSGSLPSPGPARPNFSAPVATPANQNIRGGDTYISISQQPGEDAEGLAQRVARIIDERRRNDANSALYDQAMGVN